MRLVTTFVVAVACAVGAGRALADAEQNPHNCAGSFSSAVTPEFTAGGGFGAATAASAQAGTRDDAILGLVDALANCGSAR